MRQNLNGVFRHGTKRAEWPWQLHTQEVIMDKANNDTMHALHIVRYIICVFYVCLLSRSSSCRFTGWHCFRRKESLLTLVTGIARSRPPIGHICACETVWMDVENKKKYNFIYNKLLYYSSFRYSWLFSSFHSTWKRWNNIYICVCVCAWCMCHTL